MLQVFFLPKHLFIPLSHCDKVSVLRGFSKRTFLAWKGACGPEFVHLQYNLNQQIEAMLSSAYQLKPMCFH